jgi:hypothetical protein
MLLRVVVSDRVVMSAPGFDDETIDRGWGSLDRVEERTPGMSERA